MRILLVADTHSFSTVDVYNGYCNAMRQLNINFDFFPTHEWLKLYSKDITIDLLISKILSKADDFTHVLFVNGLEIPEYVYRSKYDKKFGIIATDDPHSSIPNIEKAHNFDYYFSNEKTCADTNMVYGKTCYLPTAATNTIKMPNGELPDEYKSDVCFIGSVYPNRAKILEEIGKYCEEKSLKFNLRGHLQLIRHDSPLHLYGKQESVPNWKTMWYYMGARVCINLFRPPWWSPRVKFPQENPWLFKTGRDNYSLNPRSYEIAIAKTLQITEDRPERWDVFGGNVMTADTPKEWVETLDYALNDLNKDKHDEMVEACYEKVLKNHTYLNRVATLINFIKEQEKGES